MSKITMTGVLVTSGWSMDDRLGFHERFSHHALKQMAKMVVGKPLTVNFDPDRVIGTISSAKVNDAGEVNAAAEISDRDTFDKIVLPRKVFFAPGFIVKDDKWDVKAKPLRRTVKELSAAYISLTTSPVQGAPSRKPVEIKEQD